MTDNDKPLAGADGQGPEPSEDKKTDDLPTWARDAISKANREAADYRTKLRAIEDQQRKMEEEWAKEQGEYKPLWEKAQTEITDLRAKAERSEVYQKAFEAALAVRLKAIPDEFKTLVPAFDDPVKTWEWLDANSQLFARRLAPKLDAGAQGDAANKIVPKLTVEQMKMAKLAGMTPEQYAAQLAKQAERSAQPQEQFKP